MKWLPDTNMWIEFLRGRNGGILERVSATPDHEFALSSIVFSELLTGAKRVQSERGIAKVEELASRLVIVAFDEHCARVCAEVEADLISRGMRIGSRDVQIASTALANGLTLVTHNVAEFSRVKGLAIEDWQAAD